MLPLIDAAVIRPKDQSGSIVTLCPLFLKSSIVSGENLFSINKLPMSVSLGKKEWLSTAFHAYKGFIIIKDVYDKAPFIKDSRLPIGIIIYYAGISNTLLKYTVNFYGLDASTEVGINEISDAANSSDWAWIEATGILSFLYLSIQSLLKVE